MKSKIVPEFYVTSEVPRGAGFVPGNGDSEVELWQLWCRHAEGEEARRATFRDVRTAGFVRRKKVVGKGKAADKSARRK